MKSFIIPPLYFIFVTALLFSCGKNPASSGQTDQSQMQKRVDAILNDVAAIRGMSYKRPVRVGVTTKEQYAAYTAQNISTSVSGIEDAALSKEYAQMCFLAESDTPLSSVLTDFYASFPAAYYSLGTDSLTIISDNNQQDYQLNMTIAHELTHALQDQNLNTGFAVFPEYSAYNSDASLARRSLMEGDAFFTELAYFFKKYHSFATDFAFDTSLTMANGYKKELLNATYEAGSPAFLDVKSMVPYFIGSVYVGQTYQTARSWNPVNNLYSISTVPRSTAEINLVSPVSVTYFDFHAIHDLLAAQAGNIEYADDDNAGFALLLGMFYGDLDYDRAGRSLDWRGDHYTYIKRSGQTYGTLIWAMDFTSADGAQYMSGKLIDKIKARRLSKTAATVDSSADSSGAMVYTFTSTAAITQLKRAGDQIWWLENADTLSSRIMAILEAQRSAPALLAKASAASHIRPTLSPETKIQLIESIINHTIKRH